MQVKWATPSMAVWQTKLTPDGPLTRLRTSMCTHAVSGDMRSLGRTVRYATPRTSRIVRVLASIRVTPTDGLAKPTMQPPPQDPWRKAQELLASGAVAEGVILAANRGGVIVSLNELGQLKGYMPYSKLSPERLKAGHQGQLDYLVGQTVRTCVVQVDTYGPRTELVLSERQACAAEALRALGVKPGSTVLCEVTRLVDYGAFVALCDSSGKLTPVQGLIHITELSWDKVMTAEEVVHPGQRLTAKVCDVDAGKGRVSLSLKQMQADPLRETLDSLQWYDTVEPLPEVGGIIAALRAMPGITSVSLGRQAEEKHVVSQDLELYLARGSSAVPSSTDSEGEQCTDAVDGFALVARSGRMLQELRVTTSLSRDDMKKALTRVLSRMRLN